MSTPEAGEVPRSTSKKPNFGQHHTAETARRVSEAPAAWPYEPPEKACTDPRGDQRTSLAHGGAGEAVAVEVAVAVGVVASSVVVARLSFSAVVVACFSSVVVGGCISSMVVLGLVRSACDDGE